MIEKKQTPDRIFFDSNILVYAYSIDEQRKQKMVQELLNKHETIIISTQKDIITKALALAAKYHYTHYDSLMLASALVSGCSILYSEDMHNGQVIEDTLKLVNPFFVSNQPAVS